MIANMSVAGYDRQRPNSTGSMRTEFSVGTAATKGDWLLRLLLGLIIITIVGLVPYLGGLVRLIVVCLGLGAFSWQLYQSSRPVMTS